MKDGFCYGFYFYLLRYNMQNYTRRFYQTPIYSFFIIYVCDITEDDSLFKIKLNFTNFDFKPKSVIAIIGNCIDKISKFSGINKKNLVEYCNENKLLLNFISCAKNTATDIENIVEKRIIPRYFELYDTL